MFTLSKVRISVTGIAFSDKCKKKNHFQRIFCTTTDFISTLYVYPKNGKRPTIYNSFYMNAFYAKVHRINCEPTNNLNSSDDVNVVKKYAMISIKL